MSQVKLLKIGGIVLSIAGAGINIASEMIAKKNLANEVVGSDAFKNLVNKAVNEALKAK